MRLLTCIVISLPTLTFVLKVIPSAARRETLLWTTSLESFIVGMPYCSSPPILSFLSNTVTVWPALFSWWAAANPAGPDPTTATFRPVLLVGGWGTIQPCSNAWSIIAHSIFLIVTGGSEIPKTHAPSQGAGQTLPVNSKLFHQRIKYSYLYNGLIKITSENRIQRENDLKKYINKKNPIK